MNNPEGVPINAVFGFTNMMIKLIEDFNSDDIVSYLILVEKHLEIKFIQSTKPIDHHHLRI